MYNNPKKRHKRRIYSAGGFVGHICDTCDKAMGSDRNSRNST